MRRSTISAIRFGYGLAPNGTHPEEPRLLIGNAKALARKTPRLPLSERAAAFSAQRATRNGTQEEKDAALRYIRSITRADTKHHIANAVTDGGFGMRLVSFWADHFTVATIGPILSLILADYLETAIRPHITGRFSDMLQAVVLHPAMLSYLDQQQSAGPNSVAGLQQGRGLNENLAREIFELHTLGVNGAYQQTDVRAFAELLTGLSIGNMRFKYRPQLSEPGPHQVLGKRFGDDLDAAKAALDMVAHHPDTAQHIAQKLVRHFIGEAPPDLVTRVADAFRLSDGDLTKTYTAMLNDDRAWQPPLQKAKQPFDFIVSALRAAGTRRSDIERLSQKDLRRSIIGSLLAMGQPLFRPPGPDGWKEEPEAWINPPGLAARIRWANGFAERIQDGHDPRAFLEIALADAASPLLGRAVAGAEDRVAGIALTLMSPEFNRR